MDNLDSYQLMSRMVWYEPEDKMIQYLCQVDNVEEPVEEGSDIYLHSILTGEYFETEIDSSTIRFAEEGDEDSITVIELSETEYIIPNKDELVSEDNIDKFIPSEDENVEATLKQRIAIVDSTTKWKTEVVDF